MSKPQSGISYNPAICRRCGDTVESTQQHQFATCSCGALAVDGGLAYLRPLGNKDDWTELSQTADQGAETEGDAR